MAKSKPKDDPLARAIKTKRRIIANWIAKQQRFRAETEADCAAIQKKINRERILLESLERGSLQP